MDTVNDRSLTFKTSSMEDTLPTACSEYIANMTSLVRLAQVAFQTALHNKRQIANDTAVGSIQGPPGGQLRSSRGGVSLDSLISDFLAPFVCLFGAVGNLLNLFVLTRRRLRRSMDGLERSVRLGLVALAVSDELFCIVYLVSVCFRPTSAKHLYSPYDNLATLYLSVYHEGLINVFKVSSTWLTVNMAVGRYIAICHPLHARGYIGQRGTLVAVASIFVGSAVFNLPRFWHYQLAATPCHKLLASASSHKPTEAAHNTTASVLQSLLQQPDLLWSEGQPPSSCDCSYYSKEMTWLYDTSSFKLWYGIFCSIVEMFLPLLLLSVCNICLIRALRRSKRIQSLYRTHQKPVDSAHRITPTLIVLILLFTLLVTPSHLLVFISVAGFEEVTSFSTFRTTAQVANFMLLSNFAVNFVLYLAVNADFRRVASELVTCRCRHRNGSAAGRHMLQGASPSAAGIQGAGGVRVRYWAARSAVCRQGLTGFGGRTTDTCNLSETETQL